MASEYLSLRIFVKEGRISTYDLPGNPAPMIITVEDFNEELIVCDFELNILEILSIVCSIYMSMKYAE